MSSDPPRLVAAAQAQATLPALLDAAAAGRTTHIAGGDRVLAQLVPADALVLTADIEELLLAPVLGAEAARLAGEIEKDGYHHAGNTVGQLLSWLWESSPDAAVRWIAHFAAELSGALTARRVGRPPFGPFWAAVRLALQVGLTDDAIREFEADARGRLGEHAQPFAGAELAGQDRHRDADDPWADVTARGRCFAKKRWADIQVGDFVPRHRASDLDYDDGWCRVERLDPSRAVLRDADGQDAVEPAPDGAMWLPTRSRQPWQWGLPR